MSGHKSKCPWRFQVQSSLLYLELLESKVVGFPGRLGALEPWVQPWVPEVVSSASARESGLQLCIQESRWVAQGIQGIQGLHVKPWIVPQDLAAMAAPLWNF